MHVLGLICVIWIGQALADDAPQAPSSTDPPPESAGIWPTDKLLENMILRTARDAADRYELSPEQRRQMETQMLKRWPRFLKQNRGRLQPLLNGYLEAQFSPEPPTQEQVQAWADQALPVLEAVRQQIEAGNEDIRELLTPAQRSLFEAQAAKMRLGLELFSRRMTGWARGDYRQGDLWNPPKNWTPPTETPPADHPEVSSKPADPVELELLAWDRYVKDFMAAFDLDAGQRRAAESFLAEAKQRAQAHRDRHRLDIERLERRIQAGLPEDRSKVDAELERLYGPIDALFAELERRLKRLPTQAQQQAASQPAR
ncbi:MAG: hypothetical protein ACE5GE_15050 [Phycisphaerae bacterium]